MGQLPPSRRHGDQALMAKPLKQIDPGEIGNVRSIDRRTMPRSVICRACSKAVMTAPPELDRPVFADDRDHRPLPNGGKNSCAPRAKTGALTIRPIVCATGSSMFPAGPHVARGKFPGQAARKSRPRQFASHASRRLSALALLLRLAQNAGVSLNRSPRAVDPRRETARRPFFARGQQR